MSQEYSPLSQCVYTSSGSQSPASSLESYNVSPIYAHLATSRENTNNYLQDQVYNMESCKAQESLRGPRRTRCKMVGTQRHSASEREKMRMRNLSKALQNLRRYLPPSVAPVGRNLTKIETLRLTINYISYLSELLGINEETIEQTRQQKADMHNPCSVIPDGCQQMTCNQYHQVQNQPQSSPVYEQSHQCAKARHSAMQPENVPKETGTWVPSPYDRRHNTVTDYNMSTYYPTFTHFYQVADYHCPNLHTAIPPSLNQSDCSLRINNPLLSSINGM